MNESGSWVPIPDGFLKWLIDKHQLRYDEASHYVHTFYNGTTDCLGVDRSPLAYTSWGRDMFNVTDERRQLDGLHRAGLLFWDEDHNITCRTGELYRRLNSGNPSFMVKVRKCASAGAEFYPDSVWLLLLCDLAWWNPARSKRTQAGWNKRYFQGQNGKQVHPLASLAWIGRIALAVLNREEIPTSPPAEPLVGAVDLRDLDGSKKQALRLLRAAAATKMFANGAAALGKYDFVAANSKSQSFLRDHSDGTVTVLPQSRR